jgi:adenylate kinase
VRLVLVGPPGAGKGTQAAFIASAESIPKISTGDIFRANVSEGTDLGKLAKQYMDAGDLVPDSVTVEMVRNRLAEEDAVRGFLLDGFPRTVPQAEALDAMLAEHGHRLDRVVLMEVDEATLIDRLSGRFSCGQCGASYHERFKRPVVEGVCDTCGGTSFMCRADDRPEALATRFAAYRNQTAPILPYYRTRGILRTVDGMANVDQVTQQIESVIGAAT